MLCSKLEGQEISEISISSVRAMKTHVKEMAGRFKSFLFQSQLYRRRTEL